MSKGKKKVIKCGELTVDTKVKCPVCDYPKIKKITYNKGFNKFSGSWYAECPCGVKFDEDGILKNIEYKPMFEWWKK